MSIRNEGRLINSEEAAKSLGVSRRRVQAMARVGQLRAVRTDGRSVLIDADSLKRAKISRGQGGRPYSPELAMAALYMLSGTDASWITAQQRYRLKKSMMQSDAFSLVAKVRRRAITREYWTDERYLDELRGSVILSAGCEQMAARFQLMPPVVVEGYIRQSDLGEFERRFRLQRNVKPTVVRIHVADFVPDSGANAVMPLAVCAADLADYAEPRESRAGLMSLDDMLAESRRKAANS